MYALLSIEIYVCMFKARVFRHVKYMRMPTGGRGPNQRQPDREKLGGTTSG